jgi:hypothetical protein
MYPEPSDYEYVFKELDPLTFKLIWPMDLKWKPFSAVNAFWERFVADERWIITASTPEQYELFLKFGYKPIKEEVKEEVNYHKLYEEKLGKTVTVNKKNDIERIKSKVL